MAVAFHQSAFSYRSPGRHLRWAARRWIQRTSIFSVSADWNGGLGRLCREPHVGNAITRDARRPVEPDLPPARHPSTRQHDAGSAGRSAQDRRSGTGDYGLHASRWAPVHPNRRRTAVGCGGTRAGVSFCAVNILFHLDLGRDGT